MISFMEQDLAIHLLFTPPPKTDCCLITLCFIKVFCFLGGNNLVSVRSNKQVDVYWEKMWLRRWRVLVLTPYSGITRGWTQGTIWTVSGIKFTSTKCKAFPNVRPFLMHYFSRPAHCFKRYSALESECPMGPI